MITTSARLASFGGGELRSCLDESIAGLACTEFSESCISEVEHDCWRRTGHGDCGMWVCLVSSPVDLF
jgi:hypothetical protein